VEPEPNGGGVCGCVGVCWGGDVGQQTIDFILVSVATQIKCYIM